MVLLHFLFIFNANNITYGAWCDINFRWEHTPLSEAKEFAHTEVQQYLEQYINAHPQMM